jgi:hypothetical protein
VRQSVRLAECVGDATPVGLRLGRSALHVAHHDQTLDEVPAVPGRDRSRHRHPFTIEVPQQLDLPRQVGVPAPIAAPAEPTDGALPLTRTLHTSLTPPVVSGSIRATSSPQ